MQADEVFHKLLDGAAGHATAICVALLVSEKTRFNAGAGLVVILTGVPVYLLWRTFGRR